MRGSSGGNALCFACEAAVGGRSKQMSAIVGMQHLTTKMNSHLPAFPVIGDSLDQPYHSFGEISGAGRSPLGTRGVELLAKKPASGLLGAVFKMVEHRGLDQGSCERVPGAGCGTPAIDIIKILAFPSHGRRDRHRLAATGATEESF